MRPTPARTPTRGRPSDAATRRAWRLVADVHRDFPGRAVPSPDFADVRPSATEFARERLDQLDACLDRTGDPHPSWRRIAEQLRQDIRRHEDANR
jgi:hypothetical protein